MRLVTESDVGSIAPLRIAVFFKHVFLLADTGAQIKANRQARHAACMAEIRSEWEIGIEEFTWENEAWMYVKIILKCELRKCNVKMWTGVFWLRLGTIGC